MAVVHYYLRRQLTAIVCPLCVVYKSHGNCTFPSEWDATWYDSRGGDITMGLTPHDISSGWSFNVFNTNVTSFTCQSQETAAENYYLFKSDELVEHSNKLYNVFVCMKWTRITDYSYYYYMWQDINADAAGERVFIEEQNPYISQWNITQYCASANPPPSEQFHVLVKQGYDTNVKQWCPIPLLGTFYYTHDNGVNQTCGNGSVWEVCPSWTTITFNYTQCPTKQAFSDEGTVFCVFTQLIGSTYYASVLNPGSVDNSNYHRFTCLAVSSDSNSDDVFISDSIGSCEAGQSSTSRQVDGSGILTLTPYSLCQGSCIFPLQWESTWYDSGMGQIEIVAPSKSITSGWNINAFGQVVTSWTCQAGDTINNLLLFKSDDTVLTGGVRYNMFRCIKWREITPYSYFYYTQHDVQANAQGERVFLEVYDASVTSWDTSVYCNPSAGPPVEEFHTLVKKGFEPQVTQPCPTPLLGTFTYTHDDGTTETCGTNSQLQLCPSWNSLTFDYTKCNTEQAFSLEGAASCVMTLYDNNTSYTSVLNTGDVSSSSHDRFTCYSMNRNASFVYMSDSRGSCMERQQPTIKQTDGSGTLILTPIEYCHDSGSCLFPSDWNGEWFDSDLGEISMSSLMKSVVSGWSILIGNNTIASWSCVSSFENYILFKSDQLLDQNNTFYNVFRCIEWTKITQYSYYYYVRANEQDIANKARLTLEVYDAAVRSWDTATYCNPSRGPSKGEYHVIYKIGYENEAKQWCPTPLLGKFTYTHNNDGTLTCTGYSDLDVCTNRTTLTFNYTLCNTPQVFSEEGTVYCINTVQDGSTYYTTILNPGSLLNPFYTRITCLVITTEGSYIYASDSRGSCDNEQNSTAKQIDGSGFLTLSSYVTCEFTTGNTDESKPETSSASTAAIVGALVGLLVLIAVIAGILILCKKLKEKSMQKKTSPSEYSTGKKLPIPSTPPALTIEVTDKKKHTALPPLYPAMDVKPIHKDTEIPDSSEKPEKPKQHKHKKKKKHKQKSPRKDKDRTENPRKAETPDIIRGTSSHYVDDFESDISEEFII